MSLRLSLIKAPEGIDLSRTNYIFSQSGGTLGRADSNTWALPDPDKFLSSCHCEITFADNQFFILDRSTNGTFINGSPEPIGRGSRSPLTDGDQIELGDYRFAVALEAQSSASFESNSPFGSNHSNQAENPLLRPSNDPFADFSTAKSEDFFSSPSNDPLAFFAAPDSAPFSTPGQASPFASDTKASAASSSPFAHTGDFLSDSRESDPFAKQALDDFLGDAEIASGAKNSSAVSFASVDLSPSLDQALEWPDSTQESVIPEDWADDLLAPSAPLRPKPATPAKAITPSTNGDNWAAASDLRPTQKPAPKTSGTESSSTEPSGLPQAKPHPASDNKTALEPRQPAPGLRERVPLSERLAVLEALQNQQLNAAPNEQPLESPPQIKANPVDGQSGARPSRSRDRQSARD